jgi:pimeloyl-ACP methyl ester carboxylesterase
MHRLLLFLGLCLAVLPAGAAEPAYGHNPEAGHVAAINGIGLYYETYGAGAPLVVLHGNGGSIEAMRFQIGYFRSHRRVIAVDSRGHGRSEMGPGRLTYEQMADDVAALLAQLHAEPADVIGWSDGGIVALLLARRHPEAVRRIALSGANLTPDALAPADVEGVNRDLRNAEAKLAAGDTSQPWATLCQYLQLLATQPHLTAADLAAIRCPALVLAGEHDIIPEVHTRAIAAGLPHSQLKIIPGAGHGALQEKPVEFNAVVDAFLRAP